MTTKPDYRVPNAKLILPADASRQDWLNTRRNYLGGSDMAEISGASNFSTPFQIWQDKTSTEDPVEEEKDIFWFGQEVEPLLAARFTVDTGIATRNVGTYQSKEHPWAMANPDRLTADGGVLEIKTTGIYTDKAKDWKAGEVPDNAYVQTQYYLGVTGRSHAWFIALVDRTPHIIGPVDRDEELIAELMATGTEFWAYVESNTPPPVDLTTVTGDELGVRYPQVLDPESCAEAPLPELVEDDLQRLTEVKDLEKSAKDERTAIETRLKAVIGDHEYLTVSGQPVARWQQVAGRRSFDKTAVLEKIAAERGLEPTKQNLKTIEDEYTKVGAPTRRLSIIETKEAA